MQDSELEARILDEKSVLNLCSVERDWCHHGAAVTLFASLLHVTWHLYCSRSTLLFSSFSFLTLTQQLEVQTIA